MIPPKVRFPYRFGRPRGDVDTFANIAEIRRRDQYPVVDARIHPGRDILCLLSFDFLVRDNTRELAQYHIERIIELKGKASAWEKDRWEAAKNGVCSVAPALRSDSFERFLVTDIDDEQGVTQHIVYNAVELLWFAKRFPRDEFRAMITAPQE